MNTLDIALVLLAAAGAGWIDAVVGGGGLLQLPAMLIVLPQFPVATALGTGKLAATAGCTTSAVTYARRTKLQWNLVVPAAALALVLSGLGALCAASVPSNYFRPIIMVLLLAVALFVTLRPQFGSVETKRTLSPRTALAVILTIGCVFGFYDGVFGPGTGTFLVLSLVGLLGLDFVHGSASAKLINACTNFGGLIIFAAQGDVLWALGAGMAVCNMLGAAVGTRVALRRGAGFVRAVLLVVVTGLVIKLAFDQFS